MIELKISLIITAIHICCKDGMIFSEIRIFMQNQLDKLGKASYVIQKPLFSCIICMASVWGVLGCLYFGVPLKQWIETILTICGINVIITFFLPKFE